MSRSFNATTSPSKSRRSTSFYGSHPSSALPLGPGLDHVSAATRLLEKRKEMLEVQSALEAKREEFRERMNAMKMKEEELGQKRDEMAENLIKLEKFIRDNEVKKTRAEKKAEEEKLQKEEKIAEIKAKEQELKKLEKQKTRIQRNLTKKYIYYHEYLQEVAKLRGDENPEEVSPIINRYATLDWNNQELKRQNAELEQQVKAYKQELQRYVKEKESEIIEKNNELARLQQKLNEAQDRTIEIEHKIAQEMSGEYSTVLLLGQIKMACQNLYIRCTSKKDGSKIQRAISSATTDRPGDQLREQLRIIGECLADFETVYERALEENLIQLNNSNNTDQATTTATRHAATAPSGAAGTTGETSSFKSVRPKTTATVASTASGITLPSSTLLHTSSVPSSASSAKVSVPSSASRR